MTYLYTEANRLDAPHSYMYTPFQGEDLLRAYHADRLLILRQVAGSPAVDAATDAGYERHALPLIEEWLDTVSPEAGRPYRVAVPEAQSALFVEGDWLNGQAMHLSRLNVSESIETLDLVHSLIAAQRLGLHAGLTKEWLDRLVQRFEVSKKIYETYLPGFRKGEGTGRSVRLYWLFAMALCLHYTRNQQLKFLSTLLKVCDLLCSLPQNLLAGYLSSRAMATILAVEIVSVKMLAEERGVSVALE
jgi:hypothetical protein